MLNCLKAGSTQMEFTLCVGCGENYLYEYKYTIMSLRTVRRLWTLRYVQRTTRPIGYLFIETRWTDLCPSTVVVRTADIFCVNTWFSQIFLLAVRPIFLSTYKVIMYVFMVHEEMIISSSSLMKNEKNSLLCSIW